MAEVENLSQKPKLHENTRDGENFQDKAPDLSGIPNQASLLPGMTKEYSGWEVYNNEAKKVDTELVKDWTTNLNSLLLFAAIFAAVLTGFIIESKKMLEQNSSDVMMDVLIRLTNNLANGTHNPYVLMDFQAPQYAVTINSLFFASLSASLIAALASVVALQWVADYDAAITRGGSSPEDRAKRRQFRHAGVVQWKMGELIAAIPIFLYCSVVLFFTGLTLWMWVVHQTVGAVVAGGAAIAVLFYGGTTFLVVAFVSAPFRTPLSRWVYSLLHLPFSLGYCVARATQSSPSMLLWLEEWHTRGTRANKREDDEVKRKEGLGISALVWLANELSVSPDSYRRLMLLVSELPKLKPDIALLPTFLNAPWFSILDLLARKHLEMAPGDEIAADQMRETDILVQCYCIPKVHGLIQPAPSVGYFNDNTRIRYWSHYCDIQRSPISHPAAPNSLYLFLRDIPLPSGGSKYLLEATIRLSRWRNSHQKGHEIWGEILALGIASSSTFLDSYITVLVQFIKANGSDFYGNYDSELVYAGIMHRIVWTLIKDHVEIPTASLRSLQRCFESLVMGRHFDDEEFAYCLSEPPLYRQALYRAYWPFALRHQDYYTLHCAFIVLFSKKLNSYSGIETHRRVKEVLIMLWECQPPDLHESITAYPKGNPERYFEQSEASIMQWIIYSIDIPYIHDILQHLATVQARQPEIGPLWRVAAPQTDIHPNFSKALASFQYLIDEGVTPQQHSTSIQLLCEDLEQGPPETFDTNLTPGRLNYLNAELRDPCLRTLTKSAAGVNTEYFPVSFIDTESRWDDSWTKIAAHLMYHYHDTKSRYLLELQASLWAQFSDREELCQQARSQPDVLDHIHRIFEFHTSCSKHHNHSGHLLLHIFPLARRSMLLELLLYFLFPREEPAAMNTLGSEDRRLHLQIRGIFHRIKMTRLDLLETLHDILVDIIEEDLGTSTNQLMEASKCVRIALSLPCDRPINSLVCQLIRRINQVKEQVLLDWPPGSPRHRAGVKYAGKAITLLNIHLARTEVFGQQNIRMVSCARATNSRIPAIGWMPAHIGP